MADTLERLVVSFEARTDQFQKEVEKLRSQVNKHSVGMAGDMKAMSDAIIDGAKRIGETFGIALGAGALYEFPKQIAEAVKSVADLGIAAQKAGVSVEQLQRLTFAAIGTGLDQSGMVDMLEKLNKNIGEADVKGGDLKKLFDANGLSIRDNNGHMRQTVEYVGMIADLVKNARDDQQATVISTLAFGRAGAEALSFLKQGSLKIVETGQRAVVVTDELTKKAREFDDAWQKAWANFGKYAKAAVVDGVDAVVNPPKGHYVTAGKSVHFVPDPVGGGIHGGDVRADGAAPGKPTDMEHQPADANMKAPADITFMNDSRRKIEEMVASLNLETSTFGQSAGAIARAKEEQKLLNEEKLKGIQLSPQEQAALNAQLDALQKAVDANEKFRKSLQASADASQALAGDTQDFVHSLMEGRSVLASIGDEFRKILENIVDANLTGSGSFAGLFGTQGQNGMPGGVIGNLLSGLFKPGAAPAGIPGVAGSSITQSPLSGTVISSLGDLTSGIRIGGSRSWRNNNPGNIEYGPFAIAHGATGTDGRFAQFPDFASGRAAQSSLLFDSSGYRNLTLGQAINKWAPGTENNVPAYIKAMGADPSMRMSQFSAAQRNTLLDNMQSHEGWTVGQYQQQLSTSLQAIPTATTNAASQYGSSLGTSLSTLLQSLFHGFGGGGGLFGGTSSDPITGGSGSAPMLAPSMSAPMVAPSVSMPSFRAPSIARPANSNRFPGGGSQIHIFNNHVGAHVQAREMPGTDGPGSRHIEIAINEIDRQMARKYGLKPTLNRRG